MRIWRGRRARDDAQRIVALASQAGEPLDAVLREVADFRLALETDLIIAAAAVDADHHEIAADVVDAERVRLAGFRQRVAAHLAGIAAVTRAADPVPRPLLTRLGGLARVAAVAVSVAGLVGSGMLAVASRPQPQPVAAESTVELADQQLDVLAGVAYRGSGAAEMEHAAAKLHATISNLIDAHAQDPALAAQIAALLAEEQQLLASEPHGQSMLGSVQDLARRLLRIAPRSVRATIAPLVVTETPPRPAATTKSTTSPKPAPKPTSSPSPSPSAAPKASPSPSPSSSPQSSESSGGDSTDDKAVPAPPVP